MDHLDGPSGRTSSLYLKHWPVCIFKDGPFSLYDVAASESEKALVVDFTLALSSTHNLFYESVSLIMVIKFHLIFKVLQCPIF